MPAVRGGRRRAGPVLRLQRLAGRVQVRHLEDDRRQEDRRRARRRRSLRKGRSPLLKGFKSKAGKPFDARLKLEDGAVRFDFES